MGEECSEDSNPQEVKSRPIHIAGINHLELYLYLYFQEDFQSMTYGFKMANNVTDLRVTGEFLKYCWHNFYNLFCISYLMPVLSKELD